MYYGIWEVSTCLEKRNPLRHLCTMESGTLVQVQNIIAHSVYSIRDVSIGLAYHCTFSIFNPGRQYRSRISLHIQYIYSIRDVSIGLSGTLVQVIQSGTLVQVKHQGCQYRSIQSGTLVQVQNPGRQYRSRIRDLLTVSPLKQLRKSINCTSLDLYSI